jgi:cell division transport system permease protein
MRRLTYLIVEAFANIRRNRTTSLIAVATTAFTLVCFGLFLLLYLNLKGITGALKGDIKVIVYLQDDLGAPSLADLQRRIKTEREVAAVSYVSKEQALADFRKQFPTEQHLLQGLGENPLPASLIVTLHPGFGSGDAIRRWAERIQAIPGVAQVQYSQEWVEHLTVLIRSLELGAVVVGGVLSSATVAIIASTIRLGLFARREEIEILQLVGAGRLLINVPFVLEGAVVGMVGGIVSFGLLRGGFAYILGHFPAPGRFLGVETALQFFPSEMAAVLIVGGLLLGFTGSCISLFPPGKAWS